jgi:HK97 family phage major capsid protein
MPTLTELKQEMQALSAKAFETATAGDRTPAERREELDKIEPEIKALAKQVADEEHLADARKKYQPSDDKGDVAADQHRDETAKSIGTQFVESDGYKGVAGKSGQFSTGAVEVKATMTESASTGILPAVYPGIVPILLRRLTVAQLMPSIPVSSTSLRVIKETTATNAAAATAEGAAKPASTLVFAPTDEPIVKIATSIKITDEMLSDYGFVRAYVDGRLVTFVMLSEEDELLNGSGSGIHLTGILNRSGLQAAQARSTDSRAVAIYKEITKIRANAFLEPDAIVIHPTDWQSARLEADANGQFFGGGPFTGPYGNGGVAGGGDGTYDAVPYWNLRVVVTPELAPGTTLVGSFATAAAVMRKDGGITVEATNSNEDDFLKNLVALRAEERVGLAVFRPGAFGTVTGM